MVYNTQNYWDLGLFPLSGILENTTFRKLDLFPSSDEVGREDTYSVGPLRKWLRSALSKGPSWVGVFSPNFTWGRKHPVSETSYSLEYQTMEKVQNPSNSMYYSEHVLHTFRILLTDTIKILLERSNERTQPFHWQKQSSGLWYRWAKSNLRSLVFCMMLFREERCTRRAFCMCSLHSHTWLDNIL
jgi:hypothetical protein